jgi:hypothetical protein
MPLSAYNYAGNFLAAAGQQFDVQHQNMGMLEVNLNSLVPGGQEVLSRAVQEFTVPGREIPTAELPYINGNVKYNTRPSALGNISITYRDFVNSPVRFVLHEWFRLGFDEITGLALPESQRKITGFVVLFSTNAQSERTALLEGLMLTKEPEINVSYGAGEHMVMQVDLSVDRILWQPNLAAATQQSQ